MHDFFHAGGFGMYPILLFGLFLVAACTRFAIRPNPRHAWLALILGLVTFAAGLLGAFTGFAVSAHYLHEVPKPEQLEVLALGFGQSAHDLVLALLLIIVGGLIACVGALRSAPRVTSDAGAR
jgi:amino acid transporter